MSTIASLGISVDSTSAVQASANLDKLSVSAVKTGSAVDALKAVSASSAVGLKSASASIAEMASKQQSATQVLNSATISAGQYRLALQQLPFQIHNFINGVIAGQNPLTAFVQQGSQISQSFGGAGAALRAVASTITPLTAGLVVAGGAAAGLFAIFKSGEDQANALQKAITLSGNAAGVTTSQLAALATELQKITGSRSDAVAAITAVTSSNLIPGDLIKQVSEVALQLQQTTGKAISETVQEFAELGKDPVAAVEALQQKYNFLTVSVYEQIRALQAEGQTGAAGDVARAALLEAEQKQVATLTGNVGTLEGAWNSVTKAAKGAWQAILNVGVPETAQQTLDRLQAMADKMAAGKYGPGLRGANPNQFQEQLADARKVVDLQNAEAQQNRDRSEDKKNYIALLAAEGLQIDANAQKSSAAFALNQAFVSNSVQNARDTIQNQSDILEAQRNALLISDKDYYAARKKLIDEDTQAQIYGIEAQNQLFQQQIAKSRQRAADILDNTGDPATRTQAETARDIEVAQAQASIEANLSRINALQDQGAAKAQVLGLQQVSAARAMDQAYKDLVRSSDDYIRSLEQQNSLSLAGVGAGRQSRERASQLAEIQNHYEQQVRDLQAQREKDPLGMTDSQFQQSSDALKAGLDKARANYYKYYSDLDDKQGDWVNGAKEALSNYVDAAKNVANLADQAFTSAFQNIEDAVVNFATTGKFSFKDFANSILADLVRVEVRILESKALASILGIFNPGAGVAAYANSEATSVTDMIGALGGLASGGPASAGTPYIVGERGPELFVPKQGGTVIPNHMLGGLGGPNINVNMTLNAAPGNDVAQTQAMLNRAKQEITTEIYNNLLRSGQWKAAVSR